MSALPRLIDEGAETGRDLIERIARALPQDVRADYYREMAYCRLLPESDEMLRILRVMQFLTLLIEAAPGEVAAERVKMANLLGDALTSIQSSYEYQRQIIDCIRSMPDEIRRSIHTSAIAESINQDLRQRFADVPETVQTLSATSTRMKQAVAEFDRTAVHLTSSYTGAAESARQAIDQIATSITQAATAAKAASQQLSKTFGRIYRWAVVAVCLAALIAGFAFGITFHEWRDSVSETASAAANDPAPEATQQVHPATKRKSQTSADNSK